MCFMYVIFCYLQCSDGFAGDGIACGIDDDADGISTHGVECGESGCKTVSHPPPPPPSKKNMIKYYKKVPKIVLQIKIYRDFCILST